MPAAVPTQSPSSGLAQKLERGLARFHVEIGATLTDVDVTVPREELLELVKTLRDTSVLSFDYLRNVAGVDYEAEGMALKYHFYSFKHGHTVQLTIPLPPHQHPHVEVPSLTSLWPAANWHEREAAEMFGITFTGHPDPKNLLLEEDLHIHPLLKAHPLQAPEILQGIESGPPGFTF